MIKFIMLLSLLCSPTAFAQEGDLAALQKFIAAGGRPQIDRNSDIYQKSVDSGISLQSDTRFNDTSEVTKPTSLKSDQRQE